MVQATTLIHMLHKGVDAKNIASIGVGRYPVSKNVTADTQRCIMLHHSNILYEVSLTQAMH